MKQLNKFADKRFKNLINGLKSYQHVQDPEVLHTIRVEVKKIKALLNLTNFSVSKFKGHQRYIPFRTIFRRAGEIRQPEVLFKLLLKYQIAGVADTQIPAAKKEDKLSAAFQKEAPEFIRTVKEQRKKLQKYFDKVSKLDARKYLKKKKRELERLLFPTIRKSNLHKARKIDKEIIYLSWADQQTKPVLFYTEIENIIGQWHDKQVLLPILKKCNSEYHITNLTVASTEDIIQLRKRCLKHYS